MPLKKNFELKSVFIFFFKEIYYYTFIGGRRKVPHNDLQEN